MLKTESFFVRFPKFRFQTFTVHLAFLQLRLTCHLKSYDWVDYTLSIDWHQIDDFSRRRVFLSWRRNRQRLSINCWRQSRFHPQAGTDQIKFFELLKINKIQWMSEIKRSDFRQCQNLNASQFRFQTFGIFGTHKKFGFQTVSEIRTFERVALVSKWLATGFLVTFCHSHI